MHVSLSLALPARPLSLALSLSLSPSPTSLSIYLSPAAALCPRQGLSSTGRRVWRVRPQQRHLLGVYG